MKRITVLLVDDNRGLRGEIRKLLEYEDDLEVVGEAKNGLEAIARVEKLRPAVVLMDITMPRLNGLYATRRILKVAPATKVLMFSVHNDDVCIEEAIKCGAMGYLIKHSAADIICAAIREVQKGKMFFSPLIPSSVQKRLSRICSEQARL